MWGSAAIGRRSDAGDGGTDVETQVPAFGRNSEHGMAAAERVQNVRKRNDLPREPTHVERWDQGEGRHGCPGSGIDEWASSPGCVRRRSVEPERLDG